MPKKANRPGVAHLNGDNIISTVHSSHVPGHVIKNTNNWTECTIGWNKTLIIENNF